MKAALYIRVSTDTQIDNYSIPDQEEKLRAYCLSKDWEVYDVYIDGGYSGSNIDRPALQHLLSDLERIDIVVVYKLDRLSRSLLDTMSLIDKHFHPNGVEFVSTTESFDTSSHMGKMMLSILASFAEYERNMIAERMRVGHIKRAEEGLRGMGGNHNPSGYERQDGKLIINKKEADHIKLVFDLYEQYHSITKVQNRLKALGEPVWRFRRYRDILSNKLYCGYVSFSGKLYRGKHDPIITEEQFDRVQALLERHKGNNAHKAKESLLSGLVVCGHCGETFVTHQSKHNGIKYRYLCCRARRFSSEYDEKCMNKNWKAEELESIVINAIKDLSIDREPNTKKSKPINYDKLLKNVDTKRMRVLDLYADGSIDKSLLDSQMSKLDEEKRGILDEKNKKQPVIDSNQMKQVALDLSSIDFSKRQAAVQLLIEKILINGENISIEWAF